MDEEQAPAPQDQIQDPVIIQNAEGQQFTASGAQALDYLREGYTLAREQPNFRGVPVRTGTGEVRELPPEEAEEQIRTGLGEVVPRGDLVDYEERQVYESGAGQAAAAAAGLARGATAGLSDAAAGALDPSLPGGLQRLRQANPGTSLAGELGGNVATLLATGGAAGLGNLAGRGAVAAGAAKGGLVARALSGAAVGAAEMGVLEAGQEISQATLQERETSAAKVAEAFGHGALLGGAFGGALPVAGAALSGAAGLVKRGAGAVAERVAPGGARPFAEEAMAYAREKTLKSTGGTSTELGKILDATPGLRQAADDILIKDAPRALGKAEGAILAREQMQAGIEAARQEIGAEMGAALKAIDKNARGVGADISGIVARARIDVLAPLEANVFAGVEARNVAKQIQQLEKLQDFRVGFESLHDLSSQLGKVIRKNPTAAATEDLRAFRSLLEEEIVNGANRVSAEIGGDIAGQYATARTRYAAAKLLEDAVATGVRAETKNLTFSLSSMLAGGTGTSLGATVGGAVAGPVGAAIGGVAGGVGGAVLANLNKRFGDQVVSQALRAYAQGETRALGAMVDGALSSSVATYLKKGAGAVTTAASRAAIPVVSKADADTREMLFGKATTVDPKRKNLPMAQRVQNAAAGVERGGATPQQVRQAATRLQQSAETQRGRIEEAMRYAPPEVAAVLRGQLAANERVHSYLLSKIPQSSNQKHSLTPQAEGPRMSAAEVASLVTAARVASNPWSVLDSMEKGTLDREEVEALRATAPTVYASLIGAVDAELKALDEPLPYRQALQLSLLLGVTGDPSLEPSTMRWLQGAFGPPTPPAQQQTPAPSQVAPRGKISAAKDWQIHKEEA